MKINLKELKIYKDLSRREYTTYENGAPVLDRDGNRVPNYIVCDGAKQMANFIYNNMPGLPYHALSIKLYNANGPVVLNEEELNLFMQAVNMTTPKVIDAINERIEAARKG